MSGACCGPDGVDEVHQLRRSTLLTVLWINAAMFCVEFVAGLFADSSALVADSVDNLGDALTYAISLYVLHRSVRWRGGAAIVKGLIQVTFGIGILIGVLYKVSNGFEPLAPAMAIVAGLALVANLTCFSLLLKHRGEDINMRSVWLCSRNDAIGNVGVLLAAGMVALTGSFWPDVLVAVALAVLFVWTGIGVIREAVAVWNADPLTIEGK
jgi:Co/Zn/Cd efflux system component